MMNFIAVKGRLTRDPEIRRTNTGKAVCSFSVACDRDREHTDFFECVAWEQVAENIAKFFAKGRAIIIQGKLTTRDWTDKEGRKRKATEILVREFDFADSKPKDEPKPADNFDDPTLDEIGLPFV